MITVPVMNKTKLIKQEMNDRFIRLYFHQLINDEFTFSKAIEKEFESIHGELDLDTLENMSFENIRELLGDQFFTNEVFLFCSELEIKWINQFKISELRLFQHGEGKIEVPRLFTGIKQVSSDFGGLVVLECYNSQVYELYTSYGQTITDSCHDLSLGMDGRIDFRRSDSFIFQRARIKIEMKMESDDEYFPYIKDRDLLDIEKKECEILFSGISSEEDVIQQLRSHGDAYKLLQPLYANNQELALIAIEENSLSFSLLSSYLRFNKTFVTKALRVSNDPKLIYSFLDERLKKDSDIVAECGFLNADDIDVIDIDDEDLPF